MKKVLILLMCLSFSPSFAQQNDYFYNIPEAPESFSSANILSRMVDALGFRYYWATSGLENKDLEFKPNPESRTTLETLQHICGLTDITKNTAIGQSTNFSTRVIPTDFKSVRAKTLQDLKDASIYLKSKPLSPEQEKMIFESDNGGSEYPLWNLINGPLADALWHTGQVVSFRRSSGNPLPSGINVLTGIKKD
ncbi:hypothetical protein [Arcticibacterium luteifluviistationis]|uniref:DinB family protein n=1 Tax=Arcticibacterium luteifluviistationis TaxID=1784714 RepID=A0A2Z4GCP8_9BACT|nr:hypothetical protein [Arcticibacterium luteifluviistationis]AWV98914.1 hypothetical protein DJ013_12320 [Arcticibacterium luteifluviistationis]